MVVEIVLGVVGSLVGGVVAGVQIWKWVREDQREAREEERAIERDQREAREEERAIERERRELERRELEMARERDEGLEDEMLVLPCKNHNLGCPAEFGGKRPHENLNRHLKESCQKVIKW